MSRYIGFGTYGLKGENAHTVINRALYLGANFIDMAEGYNNSDEIFKAIRNHATASKERSITVFYKLWEPTHRNIKRKIENVMNKNNSCCNIIFAKHWPSEGDDLILDDLIALKWNFGFEGVGLSNCSLSYCKMMRTRYPSNEIWGLETEMHVFYKNTERVMFCKENGWRFISASPLFRCRKTDLIISLMAQKYRMTERQIMLLWNKQVSGIPVPATTNIEHLVEILQLPDITFSDSDMAKLASIKDVAQCERVCFEG